MTIAAILGGKGHEVVSISGDATEKDFGRYPKVPTPVAAGGALDRLMEKYGNLHGDLSEPGGWFPNEKETLGLRSYLMKGGFVIVDDFDGYAMQQDWVHFSEEMRKVLPWARIIEVPRSHAIFDSFFKISFDVIGRTYRGIPSYLGIFEDNDPKKRLIAIINANNDIGEFWEFSDEGFDPIAVTNEAYKFGINYLIYGLTH